MRSDGLASFRLASFRTASFLFVIALAALTASGCQTAPRGAGREPAVERPARPRPEKWARHIPDKPGLRNLHQVSDSLYRGAQPEDEAFAELKGMGIRTVINLRTFSSDRTERTQCKRNELEYVHITTQA